MPLTAVFVDFFDTIMFRHIHPLQIEDRWAHVLAGKFAALREVGTARLLQTRREATREMLQSRKEVNYRDLMMQVYRGLAGEAPSLRSECPEEHFVEIAHEIECSVEIGAQYPNSRMLHYLKNMSRSGKRLYIVSDFHLGADDLRKFMLAKHIDTGMFADIFVSTDLGAQKRTGELFEVVLKEAGVGAAHVLMIGDKRIDDGEMARVHGIRTKILPHYGVKMRNQISRRLNIDYSTRAYRTIRRNCYMFNSPYVEYTTIFYTFAVALYGELTSARAPYAAFLAREGNYLKSLFEAYQRLVVPDARRIDCGYMKVSRKAVQTVDPNGLRNLLDEPRSMRSYLKGLGFCSDEVQQIRGRYSVSEQELNHIRKLADSAAFRRIVDDPWFQAKAHVKLGETRKAFRILLDEHLQRADGGPLHLIDVGWIGHMQQAVDKFAGVGTKGWYLGTIGSSEDSHSYERRGLIFSESEGRFSRYFHVLRSNTQIYEQLLAAPHGAAQAYRMEGDEVVVEEEWNEAERALYEDLIRAKQEEMSLVFSGLCAWCDSTQYARQIRTAAATVLRSAFFADDERLRFISRLDAGFVENFVEDVTKLAFDHRKVRLDWRSLIALDKYARYFAKVQRRLPRNTAVKTLYMLAACLAYGGVSAAALLRALRERDLPVNMGRGPCEVH